MSKTTDGRQTGSAWRVAGVLGGLGLGALGGFIGSLLRSRPATIYAQGFQQSGSDEQETSDETAHGLPIASKRSR